MLGDDCRLEGRYSEQRVRGGVYIHWQVASGGRGGVAKMDRNVECRWPCCDER